MSSNKKKMAKYMQSDLLEIAKKIIIKVKPELDLEKAIEAIRCECTEELKKKVDEMYPNKEELQILLKYQVAHQKASINYWKNGECNTFRLDKLVPNSFDDRCLDLTIRLYVEKIQNTIVLIKKSLKEELKPFSNLILSCNYLEDILKNWSNPEVVEYIEKNTKKVLSGNALVVFTKDDKAKIDNIEKELSK